MNITDDTIISFGKYKGNKLANVPASYLIWLKDNQRLPHEYNLYFQNNIDVLYQEAKLEEDAKKSNYAKDRV